MAKKRKPANTLIRKNISDLMKKEGINRIEKGVFSLIEKKISKELKFLAKKFKEGLEINGSRLLTKKIAKNVLEELNDEEEAYQESF